MAKKAKRKAKEKNAGVQPSTGLVDKSSEDWEAKDALRTLVRGHEIQSNKQLMRRVKGHARKESEAHKRVLRLEGKPL